MREIKENILTVSILEYLKHTVENAEFPWYYIENSAYDGTSDNVLNYSFYHLAFVSQKGILSKYYDMTNLAALMIKDAFEMNDYIITRLRWGMTTSSSKPHKNEPHIDLDNKHKTILFYLGDSDGDTYFYNNDKEEIDNITPKMNKAVLFDGSILHSSSKPVTYGRRIVLNINLEKQELV